MAIIFRIGFSINKLLSLAQEGSYLLNISLLLIKISTTRLNSIMMDSLVPLYQWKMKDGLGFISEEIKNIASESFLLITSLKIFDEWYKAIFNLVNFLLFWSLIFKIIVKRKIRKMRQLFFKQKNPNLKKFIAIFCIIFKKLNINQSCSRLPIKFDFKLFQIIT